MTRVVRLAAAVALAGAALSSPAFADGISDTPVEALQSLSLEELANLPVTSVSRQSQSLAETPAATYVITREEIIRQGARSLPEILRLAPNLMVAQTSAASWVISARGLSGNLASQAFSNKLLVLIDGRSVYTPLFSGVYWDLQDIVMSDIDHVEVISGPAGAVWGANAVNGVINIITRPAFETQGLSVAGAGGDQERIGALRVGGRLSENAAWRVYARAYRAEATLTSNGADARDSWGRTQGGFRFDSAVGPNHLSLHGDAFRGSGESLGHIGGGNVFGRWTHDYDSGGQLQVQGYVLREQRGRDLTGGVPLWVNTYDLDVQQSLTRGAHQLVFGGGLRQSDYKISFSPGLQFFPTKGTLSLGSLFAQDTVRLTHTLHLVAGIKVEDDPYVGWSTLPSARLAWTPKEGTLVWGAISHAIRAPTPFDRDVREFVGAQLFVRGNPDYQTEKLTAYEIGTRLSPFARLNLSVSAFYNHYEDLRSIEITPVTLLPLYWGQLIEGNTKGVESWADFQATRRWRLSASARWQENHFKFRPGASRLAGLAQVGDDPKVQAMLKSSLQISRSLTWDAALRHQGALPAPHVAAYTELNSRIAWDITDKVQVAVAGYNLLHDQHQEFQAPQANAVPRSVLAELRLGF